MADQILPSSPNWYCSRISDCDERGIFCFGAKNSIFLLDLRVNPVRVTGHFQAHQERIVGLSLCHDNSGTLRCCSASEDGKVKVWNVDTRTLLHEHSLHKDRPTVVDWSSVDTELVVSGDEKGNVVFGSPGSKLQQVWQPQQAHIFCLTCSPHAANHCAIGYKNGLVLVVELSDRRSSIIHRLRGHDDEVHSVCWNPVPSSCGDENWRHNLPENSASNVGWFLASGSRDRTIRMWTESGTMPQVIGLPSGSSAGHRHDDVGGSRGRVWLTLCWLRQQATKLICSSHNGDLLQCDLTCTGRQRWSTFSSGAGTRGHSRIVFNICAGGIGDLDKLCTISMDRQIIIWDLLSREPSFVVPTLGGAAYCAAQSHLNPGRLAIGAGDNMIRVWNVRNPVSSRAVQVFWQGLKSKVTALAWHPCREGILAYGTDDGRVGIYNILVNKPPVISATYHKKIVYVLQWGPASRMSDDVKDGKEADMRVYSCGDGVILQHSAQSTFNQPAVQLNQLIRQANSTYPQKFAIRSEISWKPDFSIMAIGNDDGSVEMFHAQSLHLVCIIHVHRKLVNCVAWHPEYAGTSAMQSPNRHLVAVAGNDSSIHVINLKNILEASSESEDRSQNATVAVVTESQCQLEGHTGRITGLAWSCHDDQSRLVSASYDGTAQVWQIPSGEPVANFRGHTGRLLCVQWSVTDADVIYSGADDNTLQVWRISQQPDVRPPTGSEKRRHKSKGKSRSKSGSVKDVEKNENMKDVTEVKSLTQEVQDDLKRMLEEKKLELSKRLHGLNISKVAGENEVADDVFDVPESTKTAVDVLGAHLAPSVNTQLVIPDNDGNDQTNIKGVMMNKAPDFHGDSRQRKRKTRSLLPLSSLADNRGKLAQHDDCMQLADIIFNKDEEKKKVLSDDQSHLGCFVDRRTTYNLLNTERDHHRCQGNMEQYSIIEMFMGNPVAALRTAADAGQLNDWLISMAPMASTQLWQEMCIRYAHQLQGEGQIQKCVAYLLAVHKVNDAIEVLQTNNFYKEAFCLARVRLSPFDPVLINICTAWAAQLTKEGNYEMAAKCNLAFEDAVEAASLLARRSDLSALKTAVHLTLAAGHFSTACVYAQKYIQACQLKSDWSAAVTMVKTHTSFMYLGLMLTVHEVLTRQLVSLSVVPDDLLHEAVFTRTFQADSAVQLPAHFELDGCHANDLQPPWSVHLIDEQTFCYHVVHKWVQEWEARFDSDDVLGELYERLAAHKLTQQSHTQTRQLLAQISVTISLGLLKLLLGDREGMSRHWVDVLHLCHETDREQMAEGVCRLLFPYGVAETSLQTDHVMNSGVDELAIGRSLLDVTWMHAVEAFYSLSIVKHYLRNNIATANGPIDNGHLNMTSLTSQDVCSTQRMSSCDSKQHVGVCVDSQPLLVSAHRIAALSAKLLVSCVAQKIALQSSPARRVSKQDIGTEAENCAVAANLMDAADSTSADQMNCRETDTGEGDGDQVLVKSLAEVGGEELYVETCTGMAQESTERNVSLDTDEQMSDHNAEPIVTSGELSNGSTATITVRQQLMLESDLEVKLLALPSGVKEIVFPNPFTSASLLMKLAKASSATDTSAILSNLALWESRHLCLNGSTTSTC